MRENPAEYGRRQWFVMRDLKRANAKNPAYAMLAEKGFEVFTPMTTRVSERGGKKERREVPFIQDLLFVKSTREELDPVVERTETLQYRFLKGHAYGTAMVVPDHEMDSFIVAVRSVATPRYYHLDEITPEMYGARVRIIGDSRLDGLEGTILKIKGARKKRILIELPGLLAAAVELSSADLIQPLDCPPITGSI